MVKLPLCFEARSAASVFRQVLDDMNLVYSRQNGTRRYTRFAAIVALEQSAFSYKYIVDNPSINFEIWSEVPSLSGSITYLGVDGDSKSEFQNILRAIGFEVRLKPFISRSDGSAKGDWDVGITIDVMEYAQQSDIVVLASGDGDFDLLLKKIKTTYNTDSEIYGVPTLTANSLIKEATWFNPIGEKLLLK